MAALALSASAAAFAVPAASAPERRVQLSAHDEPVRDVLLRLGNAAHVSVTVADTVHGNVTLALHDVTPDQAFRAVCEQARLRCVHQGAALAVSAVSSAVVPLTLVPAARAAQVVRSLYPSLGVRTEPSANALVLSGADADVQSAKAVVQGLDVRDATKPTSEAIQLHTQPAPAVAEKLRALYPAAKIGTLSRSTLLVSATPPDLAQIKSLVISLDAPAPVPAVTPPVADAVPVTQRRPQDLARAVSSQIPHVRAAVSGSAITLTGSPDDVGRAKALIAQLDVPAYGMRYAQIYRLRNVDAKSVADLIARTFPTVGVTVDAPLNALSVVGTAGEQQHIADGIAQLDGAGNRQSAGGEGAPPGGGGPSSHEVVLLRSIVPGQAGGTSTSAQDIATAVLTALQPSNPDLRVTVPAGTQQLILTGSPQSIATAKDLIATLDVVPQSVVLDTEILELDENSSRNLGLQLGTTTISSNFSEVNPPINSDGTPGRLIRLQPLTRTGITFQAQLNLLIQNGKARVLADPRITTLSGRTASIRAGDTISILTTVGGGTGTVATTQLQSFQTGVTLDITPIVTNTTELSVALHPVVNSLTGYFNGVPEISTRDAQTTVHLQDNETLVIGGLIQENTQRAESKVPIAGDLPLIGRIFRSENVTSTRSELIIVVTPHLLNGTATAAVPGALLPGIAVPSPQALPTLPPQAAFPSVAPVPRAVRTAVPRPTASPAPSSRPAAGAPAGPAPGASGSPRATPAATPSAFAQANVYTYGSPPPNAYAGPGDTPQIFYATLSPTILTPSTTVRVNAITTTNVQRVTLSLGSIAINLSALGNGQWQGIISANTLGLPPTATSARLNLVAARPDGQSASIQIPVSVPSSGQPEL